MTAVPAAIVPTPGEAPHLAEHSRPEPGDGELLVTVHAAPITPLDLLCAPPARRTSAVPTRHTRPCRASASWSGHGGGPGRHTRLVRDVRRMRPGDGSMRGCAVVPEADVVPLPPGAGPVQVAALGLSAAAA
ncbi:hypothetical protein [Pseudonocardia sp.]|uniref:hypothetical protein n=1 Tax=Pseudonocardia sp. TaxID=60912 RepID=UPI0031FCA260